MKTFSKVLSMILVGVMCFGLFAGSAFASEFVFNDDGGSTAATADLGGEFTFGSGDTFPDDGIIAVDNTPAAGSTNNNNEFAFGDNGASQTPADSFTFEGGENNDAKPKVNEEFTFGDDDTFDKRWIRDDAADYTWAIDGNPEPNSGTTFAKNSTTNVVITSQGTKKLMPDTFDSYAYTKNGSFSNAATISESSLIREIGKVELKASWLKTLAEGTYYIWGVPALDAPQYLGFVQINAGTYNSFSVSPTSYTKYATGATPIAASGAGISQMLRFGVASITGSYTHILTANEYTLAGTKVTLAAKYLDDLPDGTYYFIGFPSATDNSEYVKSTNTFMITTSNNNGSGKWTLTPDYPYAWTSGDDYLVFWSDLMAQRKFSRQHVVLRYGYGANTIPNIEVGVHQFWDFEDGTFALGTNFLNSLPAGVYTLQVVDMKPANIITPGNNSAGQCTNTVTFRVGAKLIPIDSDKHVINSIRNLRYLCDEPVAQVYVGNIPLEYGVDYALSANRKTVTLSYEFLNKRSAGNTYTIKVLTDSGTYCSSTFQILTTAQGGASPRTGDESNLGLWAAFLLLSGTAVVVLIPKLRKHDI